MTEGEGRIAWELGSDGRGGENCVGVGEWWERRGELHGKWGVRGGERKLLLSSTHYLSPIWGLYHGMWLG